MRKVMLAELAKLKISVHNCELDALVSRVEF